MTVESDLELKDFKVGDLIYYDEGIRCNYAIIVEIKENKLWSHFWSHDINNVLVHDYTVPVERLTCMYPHNCFKLSTWQDIFNHKNGRG